MASSSKSFQSSSKLVSDKKYQGALVASPAKTISPKTVKHIVPAKHLILSGESTSHLASFFVKVVALEVIRRFAKVSTYEEFQLAWSLFGNFLNFISKFDISELNLPKSTSISFPNGKDDLMNFEIIVRPDEGYYLGGTFVFTFQVSPYPHEPPKVKCNTKVYHPNIDLEGNVCITLGFLKSI
uniref:UBC core domain-containing protein n=1 Tax=Oryza brachyantha TaxID=4533 RepID=J3LV25_ORYBR